MTGPGFHHKYLDLQTSRTPSSGAVSLSKANMGFSTAKYSIQFTEFNVDNMDQINLTLRFHRTGFFQRVKNLSEYRIELTLLLTSRGGKKQKPYEELRLREGPIVLHEFPTVTNLVTKPVVAVDGSPTRFAYIFNRQVGEVRFEGLKIMSDLGAFCDIGENGLRGYLWEARLFGPKRASCWDSGAKGKFLATFKKGDGTVLSWFAQRWCTMTASRAEGDIEVAVKFEPQ